LASLREKLKALEELQQIDLESHEVRTGLAGLPARKAVVEAKVLEARKAYDAHKALLESNERERRQIETLLAMERDKVKKWEGRLGEIKTPREYAALSREIDIAKKTNESQGEQSRALTDAALALRQQLEQKGEGLSDAEDAAEAGLAALEQERVASEARLADLTSRRAGAVAQVDPELYGKYENIRKRRAGVAVSPVVGSTCKGCHRNIPPQLSIGLQRVDSIETCPNCHRIIYSAAAVNPAVPPPSP